MFEGIFHRIFCRQSEPKQLDRLLLSVSAGPPADTMRSVSKAVRAITNPIFLPGNLKMDKADSARIRIDCLALFARFRIRFHTVGLAAASEDGASRIQCEKSGGS
jgi:hypothetical protein